MKFKNLKNKIAHILGHRLNRKEVKINFPKWWVQFHLSDKLFLALFLVPKETTSVLYCKRQTSILKATKSSVHLDVI